MVGTQLQRQYEFIYAQSQATQKDLLVEIRQYGSDGTGALPSITFNYDSGNKGFDLASSLVSESLTYFLKSSFVNSVPCAAS